MFQFKAAVFFVFMFLGSNSSRLQHLPGQSGSGAAALPPGARPWQQQAAGSLRRPHRRLRLRVSRQSVLVKSSFGDVTTCVCEPAPALGTRTSKQGGQVWRWRARETCVVRSTPSVRNEGWSLDDVGLSKRSTVCAQMPIKQKFLLAMPVVVSESE